MTLSDTDLVLLSAAAQRSDELLHPSSSHDEASRGKIAERLIRLGLVDEVEVGSGPASWGTADEAHRGLKINAAGLAALGLDDDSVEDAKDGANEGVKASPPQSAKREGGPSKISLVIALLERAEGASLDELRRETGWLPHTVRAALTGLRKKGHTVVLSSLADGRRIYHLHAPIAVPLADRNKLNEVR